LEGNTRERERDRWSVMPIGGQSLSFSLIVGGRLFFLFFAVHSAVSIDTVGIHYKNRSLSVGFREMGRLQIILFL
jgi:hypothetical protein